MKKLLLTAGFALLAFSPAAATAAPSCHTVACLNRQVGSLRTELARTQQALLAFANCLGEVPMSTYGDPNQTFGYAYSPDGVNTLLTTAVDTTMPGTTIDGWMLFDRCNTRKTASADTAHLATATGAIAPMFNWTPLAR